MADPATIAMAVKAAVAVATDKRTWTVIGTIVAAVLAPFILFVVVIICILSGTASHNNAAIDQVFKGGSAVSGMPSEYQQYIDDMQNDFTVLDAAIATVNPEIESGSVDSTRVKAVFYSLYFGVDNLKLNSDSYIKFVDCFVKFEQTTDSQTGAATTVAVPLTDLDTVYANVSKYLGRAVTNDEKENAANIYEQILYGNSPTDGGNSGSGGTASGSGTPAAGGSVISPVGSNWRSIITSGYGYRNNPTGPGTEFHSGIDLGVPIGTLIHAATDGKVKTVKYDPNGYGNYIVIDRGDGFCTLYGHCSQVIAAVGQIVHQGDVIAYSGSTGNSTGPHLHFEVDINGKSQDPRNYLQ
jgi:murein DD-endopeptidase MepM/ murein hydrolase activator NlpD